MKKGSSSGEDGTNATTPAAAAAEGTNSVSCFDQQQQDDGDPVIVDEHRGEIKRCALCLLEVVTFRDGKFF